MHHQVPAAFEPWSMPIVLYGDVNQYLSCLLYTNSRSEQFFSALRHLKTQLRGTMNQYRLHWCMILHIHTNGTDKLNFTVTANKFVARKSSRQCIFGKFLWLVNFLGFVSAVVLNLIFGLLYQRGGMALLHLCTIIEVSFIACVLFTDGAKMWCSFNVSKSAPYVFKLFYLSYTSVK